MVGVLRRATSGAIDFQYDQQWLDRENRFAISLSLPLREDCVLMLQKSLARAIECLQMYLARKAAQIKEVENQLRAGSDLNTRADLMRLADEGLLDRRRPNPKSLILSQSIHTMWRFIDG